MNNHLRDFLKDLGVSTILFCSGARNNNILDLLGDSFQIEFHLDERAACFEAIGRAKFTGQPIVVCTTSGTAVAECLAGLIEAYYSEIPVIIISADRPSSLRFTHAPQAIDQTNIFSTYTRSKYSGTLEDFRGANASFPMQLNFEIDDAKETIEFLTVKEIDQKTLTNFNKPLVLITEGHNLNSDDLQLIDTFKCYKFCEGTSNIYFEQSGSLTYENEINELIIDKEINSIFHFGRTPVLKLWREIEKGVVSIPVINIGREQIGLSSGFFTHDKESTLKHLEQCEISIGDMQTTNLNENYSDLPQSEISTINSILLELKNNTIVYAGNSMPIRYLELLKNKRFKIMASRGANGIDGQISTAIGIARETKDMVIAILGDLTFIYDVSSLLLKDLPKNLFIHVIDNNGGRIFERVTVDPRLINPHNKDLDTFVTANNLNDHVKIHRTDNEQTNDFWSRWNS